MANPIFYPGNLSAATYTASGGTATGFSLNNLSNYIPTSIWKSNSGADEQTLRIDFGSASAKDFIILAGHNFYDMEIVLEYDQNDSNTFANPVNALGSGYLIVSGSPILTTFTAVSRRYWRLRFFHTLTAPPELGQVFLEKSLDMGQPQEFGFTAGDRSYNTTMHTALDGTLRASSSHAGRAFHTMTFRLIGDTVRDQFQAFVEKIRGRACPFYYADVQGGLHYVHLMQDETPIEVFRYGLNNIATMRLARQVVG